jgi:hypothetical protein
MEVWDNNSAFSPFSIIFSILPLSLPLNHYSYYYSHCFDDGYRVAISEAKKYLD